ncbi:MAG: glycosyltransferase [Actinomycetia bacterium]|nr:glycosyltransferase [Actinomycetes bacterium]
MTPAVVRLPPTDDPVVSILMVLHRGGTDALVALAALAQHTTVAIEVIVIDNASPDGSGALVRISTAGITFVANSTNLGFGPAMNQAADLARADVLCLLNPDLMVGPGWISPLLELLHNTRVGAVSPVLLHRDGSIREAGSRVDAQGWTHQVTELANRQPHRVDYASAACLLVRKRAFADVGGFDGRYRLAYFEDVDLAFSLAAAGWETWLEPTVCVQHSRTDTDADGSAQQLSHENHTRFVDKWANELAKRSVRA